MSERQSFVTGKEIADALQLGVEHALYDKEGSWFHNLERFPAALFDLNGYVIFNTREDYESCGNLKISKHTHSKGGISLIATYKEYSFDVISTIKAGNKFKKIRVLDGGGARLAEEVDKEYYEGAVKTVRVNRYERDRQARNKCIEHYGCVCAVCQFNFGESYGRIGKDFIHVHHYVPISDVGRNYKVDPKKDLIPVCPNCHAIIHRSLPPFTVEEVRQMLETAKDNISSK